MSNWTADGPVMADSGVVGGDGAGQAFSTRYTRPDIPGAIITSYWYAVDESERYADDTRTGWGVENMVEYLICTDPADPGGTEVWSNYEYYTASARFPQSWANHTPEIAFKWEVAAKAYARSAARIERADWFTWNGEETA